jgi:spore germination cell wall hydrolase CwlJ-like protein
MLASRCLIFAFAAVPLPLLWCTLAEASDQVLDQTSPGAAAEGENDAFRCLALTLFWEARSEGREGMEAVASVVLNRVKSPEFPDTVCEVVHDGDEEGPCAFSWWCDGKEDMPALHENWPEEQDRWALAEEIARAMLTNQDRDITGGALYYHADDVQPTWSAERSRVAKIGRHVYYR